jgi:glycosyltransferase involved in cell wall biosynthesis
LDKKVIILGTSWPFRGGGISTYNERLARALTEKNYDVTIYTFTLQYPSFLFPGKTQYTDQPAPKDLKIKIKVNSINPFNWLKVGREIRNLSPALLLIRYWIPFMGPCLGSIARIARKNKFTKVVAIADNIIPHEKRVGDKALTKYFTKSVDAFITMSKAVLNDLNLFSPNAPKAFNPHPLYDNFGEIIPRDIAISRLKLNPDNRYMLFFGFIRDYKGLDLLLEAFADKRLREYPVKLIVAGEFYTSPDKYMDMIESLKLKEQIELHTDFIPDNDVALYFSAADIIVQPYKTATQSGVTQIGYHFNKPMLVTDVGGLSEIIPHGKVGYVVNPEPEPITEALIDFFGQSRKDSFEKNVIEEKKKYSWESMVKTIEEVIKKIK